MRFETIFRRAIWAGLLAAGLTVGASAGRAGAAGPGCPDSSPILLSGSLGCLAFNSHLAFDYGKSGKAGNIAVKTTWLRMTGITDVPFGRLAGHVTFKRKAQKWLFRPAAIGPWDAYGASRRGDWRVGPGQQDFADAYVSAQVLGMQLNMGKVNQSVAALAKDRALSPVGLAGFAIGPRGVRMSRSPALGGRSLQLMSAWGGNTFAVGLEGLARGGTAIASLRHSSGPLTGHVTLFEPQVLGGIGAGSWRGFHAGATLKAAPFRFRAALAGDSSGWLNGLASTEAVIGRLELATSCEYLRNSLVATAIDQIGCGVGGTARLGWGLGLDGGIGWRHRARSSGVASYTFGLKLRRGIAESIKLAGSIGLSGNSAEPCAPALNPYGQTKLEWAPDNKVALSAEFRRYANGDIRLATAAANSF